MNKVFVLKATGDLPQDLNKIKGGELKDNNTSFSFSVSLQSDFFKPVLAVPQPIFERRWNKFSF